MQRMIPSFNPDSELSSEDQQRVHRHHYSLSDYLLAMRTFMSIGMGLPDHSQLAMAARILGAVPDKVPGGRESPLAMWIFAETSLLLGRN